MYDDDSSLRLARARFDELTEGVQRSRRPGPRRSRLRVAQTLHRFADRLES